MNIELKNIKIEKLVEKYADNGEEGVYGFDGSLNIRPPYQREFVYDDKKRNAVIDSVNRGFPLNSIYWSVNEDGTYEVLDGQQRIISVCQYFNGDFSIQSDNLETLLKFFKNLTAPEKKNFLDYELTVYFCKGTEKEKLDWFRIINIASLALTEQELRNAVYSGPWVTSAKRYFSKRGCPAYQIAEKYLKGSSLRQQYLETAIQWISTGKIEEYMSEHQHDSSADELWLYFKRVIDWVEVTFPEYRKEMIHVDWGLLFSNYHDKRLDSTKLESEISELLMDDEVTKKSGIWTYVLTRSEKHLTLRKFSPSQKRSAFERQGKKCANCKEEFDMGFMEANHIKPWHLGGKTTPENCQILCRTCNREKSGK